MRTDPNKFVRCRATDFYSVIAPFYECLVGPFLRPVRKGACRAAVSCGCGRTLDIGCGTGKQVQMLAQHGLLSVGVDLSPAMLSRALSSEHPGASFALADARNLPFAAESFDCILISLALHEMDYSTALSAVNDALRVLTTNGKLILFDYVCGRDFLSRLSLCLLHVVERMAGKRHFKNFRFFMKQGGLEGFVRQFGLKVVFRRKYFGGSTALLITEKGAGARLDAAGPASSAAHGSRTPSPAGR